MEEKKQHSKRGRKVAYAVVGIVLGCIFLFPIYILVLNSFKNTNLYNGKLPECV